MNAVRQCDECDRLAVLESNEGRFCERCDQRLNGSVENSDAPDPGMAGFDLDVDAEISRLEAEWSRNIRTSSRNKTEFPPFPRGAA